LKPFVGEGEITTTNGRYFVTRGSKTEEIPHSLVKSVVSDKLMQDDKWQNMMFQKYKHIGIDLTDNDLKSIADEYGNTLGNAFARKSVSTKYDMKNDSEYLLHLRESYRKKAKEEDNALSNFIPDTSPGLSKNTIFGQHKLPDPEAKGANAMTAAGMLSTASGPITGLLGPLMIGTGANAKNARDSNFDQYSANNAPTNPALKNYYDQLNREVKNSDKYKTDSERKKALYDKWTQLSSKMETQNTTDINLPTQFIESNNGNWRQILAGGGTQIFEVNDKGQLVGSASSKVKKAVQESATEIRPSRLVAQGPQLGYSFEVGGKKYVSVGTSDRMTDQMKDIQTLHSPLTTGEPAEVLMYDAQGKPFIIRSLMNEDPRNPGLKIEKREPLPYGESVLLEAHEGVNANTQLNTLMRERAAEVIRASQPGKKVIDVNADEYDDYTPYTPN